jgi:hypothetical protein
MDPTHDLRGGTEKTGDGVVLTEVGRRGCVDGCDAKTFHPVTTGMQWAQMKPSDLTILMDFINLVNPKNPQGFTKSTR